MQRQLTAIALLVSFVAMATSGLLMFVIDQPSFSLRMHPVHKLFGLVLIVAALSHLTLNRRALLTHLRDRRAAVFAAVLTVALVGMYGVVALSPIPAELAKPLDDAALRIENPGPQTP